LAGKNQKWGPTLREILALGDASALSFSCTTAHLVNRRLTCNRNPHFYLVIAVIMSDNGEVEVETPAGNFAVLPKDVTAEIGSTKLFNKWSYEDVEIRDISLTYECARYRRGLR
jgi:hypothetical protein